MFTTRADTHYKRRLMLLLLAGLAGLGAAAPQFHLGRNQREELLQADRDFDSTTSRDGAEGWASFFAEDGVMMPAGGDMIVGREAIQRYAQQSVFTPGFILRWEPMDATASGNLGYTYGIYKATRVEAPGKSTSSYGKYVTVWKKLRGRWKVAVDIGNPSPAPKR